MKIRPKIVIDAEKFDPTLHPWPYGVQPTCKVENMTPVWEFYDRTLGHMVDLHAGDYIVTSPVGNRWVVTAADLAARYDIIGVGENVASR